MTIRDNVPDAQRLRDQLQAELERIESQLSHWRPTSETSQFNSSETTLEQEYSAELVSLIERARQLGEATGGAYDITAGPLVEAWGFGPNGPRDGEPTADELRLLMARIGWEKLEVRPPLKTLRKSHPLVQIDLGSLLQGYAVDRVAALLDEARVSQYLIDVGGELRSRGSWLVAIEDPTNPDRALRSVPLRDAALATSGVYRHTPGSADEGTRHIMSTRTGRPVESNWLSCSVIASTCLDADGWATALMATDEDLTMAIADREQLSAILVDRTGRQQLSAQAADLLAPTSQPPLTDALQATGTTNE